MTQVNISAQGRILQVQVSGLERPEQVIGKRGLVDSFSEQSRMRLLRLLSRVEGPDSAGYRFKVSFLTLTTRAILHPRDLKKHMHVFLVGLNRKYPTMAVLWRLEYQKRGAPHLHMILYNAPWLDKEWIQIRWSEIVGDEALFTRIERIKSYRHLMRYASKYAAKVETSGFNSVTYPNEGKTMLDTDIRSPGRVWGVYNRHYLPMADEKSCVLPFDTSWFLIRKYCMSFSEWISDDMESGFTVFSDNPYHMYDHILKLSVYLHNNS